MDLPFSTGKLGASYLASIRERTMRDVIAPNETLHAFTALASAVQAASDHDDLRAAQVCLTLTSMFAWHDPANRTTLARQMLSTIRLLDPDVLSGVPEQ